MYTFASARLLKDMRKAFCNPVAMQAQKIIQNHREILKDIDVFSQYVKSKRLLYRQSQELYHSVHSTLSKNLGKTMLGSALFGCVTGGNFWMTSENVHEQQIKKLFLKAAEIDDVSVVTTLRSIAGDQETIAKAISKHALTNSDAIRETIIHGREKTKGSPYEIDNLVKNATQANRATFAALLEKFEEPDKIMNLVIQGGDKHKIVLMVNAGVCAEKMRKLATKEKNFELTAFLIKLQEPELSDDDVLVKAKLLCEPNIMHRLFVESYIKNWKNNKQFTLSHPLHAWKKALRKGPLAPEPVIDVMS